MERLDFPRDNIEEYAKLPKTHTQCLLVNFVLKECSKLVRISLGEEEWTSRRTQEELDEDKRQKLFWSLNKGFFPAVLKIRRKIY